MTAVMDASEELIRPLGPSLGGRAIPDVMDTAVANVVLAIPFLSVGIVGEDTNKAAFVQCPSIDLEHHVEYVEEEGTESGTQDSVLLRILENQHDRPWPEIEHRPPWKLTVIVRDSAPEDGRIVLDAVFAVHHAVADGRSTALFHRKLLGELNHSSGQPAQLMGRVLDVKGAGVGELVRPQEELVKFDLSWGFLLQTLWGELAPAWLRRQQPAAPWAGKVITPAPCRTRLRLVTVPAVTVTGVLAACREHQTTLTPLLHALALASLARHVPEDEAVAFHSSTPIDLRPFIDSNSFLGGRSRDLFGVFVTGQYHTFGTSTITTLRAEPSLDQIWRVAVDLRGSMKQHINNIPRNDIMGVLGWITDWRKFWLSKVGKPRQQTWEVSNIGSMPGGHAEREETSGRWKIGRSHMSQGATVTGAAISISPFADSTASPSAVSLVQTRAKSNRLRPQDQGVVVRLLEDIPKFGRKDAIFRVERGRMRNQWYPNKKAEYMTASRFRELGLTRDDIGERDIIFGTLEPADVDDAPEVPITTVRTTTPERAHTLLTTSIPETLTFHRKPIPAPAPAPPTQFISPLVASANPDSAQDQNTPLVIYGSVSATDIVGYIKGLLAGDADGSRIVLGPEDIKFRGLSEDTDRVKALGRWEVEISVGGRGLEPVRKVVEILPVAEKAGEADAQPAP
ncbi:hypothetical protein N657DRAFT_607509 [Parathielavia appendiculata]|uniref:Ribosomal protein L9 domain-containing protein n=1 Tax=Parathielavia appendiculata TaxID=2587402 RepID=A0AAN6U8A4_9PEZI|nr:hypothetical protein N657DRAFT_607509 [Parathielavia appendiculata]